VVIISFITRTFLEWRSLLSVDSFKGLSRHIVGHGTDRSLTEEALDIIPLDGKCNAFYASCAQGLLN
jgi:hypothetical protein